MVNNFRNLSEMPSEPIAVKVMPIKTARHSSPCPKKKNRINHKNLNVESSTKAPLEASSDQSLFLLDEQPHEN
jgi:hypothetical protein